MSLPYSDTLLNVVMRRIIISDSILLTLEVAYFSCEITITLAHISFFIQMHIEESINIYWRVSRRNSTGQSATTLMNAIINVDILTNSNISK